MKYLPALVLLLVLNVACGLTVPITATSVTPTLVISATPTASSTFSPTATVAATTTPAIKPSVTPALDLTALPAGLKDVTYCSPDGVALQMDIYAPVDSAGPWPVVVYVHGGGWTEGDKQKGIGSTDFASLRQAGFLTVSVNYRFAPKYKFPAQIQDLKCAIRFLRAHATEYNLDAGRIGAWGVSAGGHLVALLGAADPSAGWDVGEYLEQSSQVQAVVDMFGPADLAHGFENLGIGWMNTVFGATGRDDPILVAASPVTYVTSDDPPFLILHGDQDELVPLEQSQRLFAGLQTAGVTSQLVIVKNAAHGFQQMGSEPINPSARQLTQMIRDFFLEQLK